MVSPYRTLLFFRKEITKLSEVTLVSVLCNCLYRLHCDRGSQRGYRGYRHCARGYRPWNTANTTGSICLLFQNGNENTEAKLLTLFSIIHLAAVRPTFGHWKVNRLNHPMLIATLFQVRPESHRGPRNEVGSQNLIECISGTRPWNPPILSVTCYPTVLLSPKLLQ